MDQMVRRSRRRLVLSGASVLVLGVGAATVVFLLRQDDRPPSSPPPPGVKVAADGAEPALKEVVLASITKIRQRDGHGLAALDVDVDTHRRGGDKAESGAQWLIAHFSDALRHSVNVEIRQDENAGVQWNACLSYGSPQHRLRLGFIEYGRKGFWPDPDGGGKYSFTVNAYSALAGTEPRPREQAPSGSFCEDGEMLPASS